MAWTVLLTAPQREFKVRDELTLSEVEAYVPVEFRLGKGRLARALKRPVAPGYVFANVSDWGMLRTIDGLRSRPVCLVDSLPVQLTANEVTAIQALSRPLTELSGPTHRLRPGERIAIKRNHLATIYALVTRIDKKGRPIATVDMLGKSHDVVVTEDMIA
jgi:hypothetical protein